MALTPLTRVQQATVLAGGSIVARVHDNRTANRPDDWRNVVVRTTTRKVVMVWYGEHLFRAPAPPGLGKGRVCATDAAGNGTCTPVEPPPVAVVVQEG